VYNSGRIKDARHNEVSQMEITVNGNQRDVAAGTTVLAVVEGLGLKPDAIVVQRNDDIVDRERFGQTAVDENDVLEVVHIVGGG